MARQNRGLAVGTALNMVLPKQKPPSGCRQSQWRNGSPSTLHTSFSSMQILCGPLPLCQACLHRTSSPPFTLSVTYQPLRGGHRNSAFNGSQNSRGGWEAPTSTADRQSERPVHLPPPGHQQALSCATADPGLSRSHLPLPALEHRPNDVAR